MRTYEVSFNDFGIVHVISDSFTQAEAEVLSWWDITKRGNVPMPTIHIKDIKKLAATNDTLLTTKKTGV